MALVSLTPWPQKFSTVEKIRQRSQFGLPGLSRSPAYAQCLKCVSLRGVHILPHISKLPDLPLRNNQHLEMHSLHLCREAHAKEAVSRCQESVDN